MFLRRSYSAVSRNNESVYYTKIFNDSIQLLKTRFLRVVIKFSKINKDAYAFMQTND